VDLREERILENEQAFAAINHRLRRDLERTGTDLTADVAFVCECGHTECHDSVSLSPVAYGRVHEDPRDFVVLPGHEIPDVEDVVARGTGYLHVRKQAY
jgi:hypothetical protein